MTQATISILHARLFHSYTLLATSYQKDAEFNRTIAQEARDEKVRQKLIEKASNYETKAQGFRRQAASYAGRA